MDSVHAKSAAIHEVNSTGANGTPVGSNSTNTVDANSSSAMHKVNSKEIVQKTQLMRNSKHRKTKEIHSNGTGSAPTKKNKENTG